LNGEALPYQFGYYMLKSTILPKSTYSIMKKTLFFLLSIGCYYLANTQTIMPLLNKEAYNFAVGDTFDYRYNRTTSFPGAFTDIEDYKYRWVVKSVSYSSNNDTLKITVLEKHEPSNDSDLKKYTKNKLSIFQTNESVFKNLPDTVIKNNGKNVVIDKTAIINFGYPTPKRRSSRQIQNSSTANSPSNLYYHFTEGLGLTQYRLSNGGATNKPDIFPDSQSEELSFYSKSGEKWGNKHKFTSATKETEEEFVLTLLPNPVEDLLVLKTSEDFEKYQIFDMNGDEVKKGNIQDAKEIGIADLAKGMYILRLKKQNKYKSTKFIKQ
jgi:hypothetical protein